MKDKWIVLEGEELKEQHDRFNKDRWKYNIFFILFFTFLIAFFKKVGIPSRFDPAPMPASWSELFFIHIPISLFVSTIGVVFFGSIIGESDKFIIVCYKCGKEKTDSKQEKCECGGTFHSTRDMKYNV